MREQQVRRRAANKASRAPGFGHQKMIRSLRYKLGSASRRDCNCVRIMAPYTQHATRPRLFLVEGQRRFPALNPHFQTASSGDSNFANITQGKPQLRFQFCCKLQIQAAPRSSSSMATFPLRSSRKGRASPPVVVLAVRLSRPVYLAVDYGQLSSVASGRHGGLFSPGPCFRDPN